MLARLPVADRLVPALAAVLASGHWRQRQDAVHEALTILHRAQHAAGLPTAREGA